MRTTVDIDARLLARLRAEAHRRGSSVKDVLAGALRRGLDAETAKPRTRRYRCPVWAMGAPSHDLDLDKALSSAAALEDEDIVRKLSLRK